MTNNEEDFQPFGLEEETVIPENVDPQGLEEDSEDNTTDTEEGLYDNPEDFNPEEEFSEYEEEGDEEGDESNQNGSSDFMSTFLRNRGIDSTKIRIQDENGNVSEVNFNDLSDEEKLYILNSATEVPISDEEINTINFLRKNRVSLADLVQNQRDQAVAEYLKQNGEKSYTVDKLSDEDLLKFDIKETYPNLTDQEIDEEIARASQDTEVFKKKAESLRAHYKELENIKAEQEEEKAAYEAEARWQDNAQKIIDVAKNTEAIDCLKLSDDDKNEVLSFILDRDINGNAPFYKMLEDPKELFKVAYYAKKGTEAIDTLNDYWRKEVEKSRRQVSQTKTQPKTVRRPAKKQQDDVFSLSNYFKNK